MGPVKRTFRAFVPDQMLLLPPSLDEWLPQDDHLVRFVMDLVDEILDLSPILASITRSAVFRRLPARRSRPRPPRRFASTPRTRGPTVSSAPASTTSRPVDDARRQDAEAKRPKDLPVCRNRRTGHRLRLTSESAEAPHAGGPATHAPASRSEQIYGQEHARQTNTTSYARHDHPATRPLSTHAQPADNE
jgi:hypothetical protein